jgi:pimeloyl-ACP methyl ester carboxylesterase
MPFLSLPNGELYFESHGDGPAILLAHGLGGNHAIWWHQIEYFAPSYRVITVDQQGFGLSKTGSEPAVHPAAALHILLDELAIEEVILVGQSMGGDTCWTYAAQHPERVRALVMSASAGPLDRSDQSNLRRRLSTAQAATRDLTQRERVFATHFAERFPASALLYSQISSFGDVTQLRLAGGRLPPRAPTPTDLPELVVPVLFVAGRHDRLYPIDIVRDTARLAGASFVELPLSGHSPNFECPDVYNFVLHTFFRAHGWGPALAESLFVADRSR